MANLCYNTYSFLDKNVKAVAAYHGVFHVHRVVDLHVAAVLVEPALDAVGVDAHGGSAEGSLVEEEMLLPLLKNHLRTQLAGPVRQTA